METLSPSVTTFNITRKLYLKTHPQASNFFRKTLAFPVRFNINYNNNILNLSPSSSISCVSSPSSRATSAVSASTTSTSLSLSASATEWQRHWIVRMEAPPLELRSKAEIIDYYVKTLETVLGSEKDAQMCIYDASLDAPFGFCCDIDAESSRELSGLQGVLSVKPDHDFSSEKKDYNFAVIDSGSMSNSHIGSTQLFSTGNSKHWLVQMDRPTVGVVTKAQMVDFYAQILTKVLGNEKDAQMCMYHVSWESNFGFCCVLDEECARELTGVPGVLSIRPDENFESNNKDYGGATSQNSSDSLDPVEANQPTNIKTKKLFVTGLSFYTSEKTLRAAFEGFGELVEVKIIMDKISKRSKGYAFIEYTTEEAANAALEEMNGKIINGWMIVVDVAKPTPQKYSRSRPRLAV